MSDASTSLADNPAGKATILRPPLRRGRGLEPGTGARWQSLLLDSPPTSVLLDEADRLIGARRWRQAIRVLSVAATTTVSSQDRWHILQRLAVTAADGGDHRVSAEAVYELQQMEPRDADTWVTFANVALARSNYGHADTAARAALAEDPSHHGAWIALAASYAGLGWFDEADDCLDHLDRAAISDRERWRIGRAVNRWALSKSRWFTVTAVAAVVVGVLAVAIASTVPFLTREWRLRDMRGAESTKWFEKLASDAWQFERKLRYGHALTVVTSVAGFVAVVLLS
ncbi:MAG: hypothetical protein ACRBK7_28090 [Acidimicrobiales bacterium]